MNENNRALRKFLAEMRTFAANFRSEINKLCDDFNGYLDETELRLSKEDKAEPQTLPEDIPEREKI